MALNALILDLDGTIVDSRPWYERVFVDRFGRPTPAVNEKLHANCPPVRLASELGIKRSHFEQECRASVGDLSPYPDIVTTLESIAAGGVPLALVTAVPASFAALALEHLHLQDAFRVVVAAKWGRRPKPAPDGILEAIMVLGLDVTEQGIWYVGDMRSDMLVAKAARIQFALATWGYGSPEEMQAADRILLKPVELKTL